VTTGENSLIQALIALTGQASSRTLDAALLEQVGALLAPDEVALYDLFDAEGREEFLAESLNDARARDALGIDRDINLDVRGASGFVTCIEAGARVATPIDGDRIRTLYPIHGETGITALLAADFGECPGHEPAWMSSLVAVYQNQKRLLFTLERDALTQLLNRQTFDRQVWEIIQRVGQTAPQPADSPRGIAFGMLDIDHFKEVNDTYGHLYGDELLLLFARLMSRWFRYSDLTFRYGGEEFCVVLFDVDHDVAATIFERFRQAVASYAFPQIGQRTVSTGFTLIRPGDQPGDLIDRADRALYFAKQHGRNRVCCHEGLVTTGHLAEEEARMVGTIELF
jgi:diguanylate cyclase (GGDEF)-like protein